MTSTLSNPVRRGALLFALALALGGCGGGGSSGPVTLSPAGVLDASRDLARYGYANMVPDSPGQDAAASLRAAFAVAQAEGFSRIVCTPGEYWLSSSVDGVAVPVGPLQGVELDLGGSELVVTNPSWGAFSVRGVQGCTFRGFTVDYDPLPFTQLTVASVQPVSKTECAVTGTVFPGYPPVSDFASLSQVYAMAYRSGQRLWGTPRWSVVVQGSGLQMTAVGGADPVSGLQPGDVLVLESRSAKAALFFLGGSSLAVRDVTVYSSPVQALVLNGFSASVVEGVTVEPRPGTDRLVSSNAGGIVLEQAGSGNRIAFCNLVGTQDDSIAVNYLALGQVQGAPSGQQLQVKKLQALIPTSAALLVDPDTCAVLGEVDVVGVADPSSPPGSVTAVTVTGTLPGDLPAGTFLCGTGPDQRARGLVVTGNRIVSNRFARGMTLWGLTSATITGNFLHETCMAGIDLVQKLSDDDWQCAPNEGYEVSNNVVELANQGVGALTNQQFGAIQIASANASKAPVSGRVNRDISVSGNLVRSTTRTGIWMQNVGSGQLLGNLLQGTSTNPGEVLAPFDTPSYLAAFGMPLVTWDSDATVAGNVVDDLPAVVVAGPVSAGAAAEAVLPPGVEPVGMVMTDALGEEWPVALGGWAPPVARFVVPPRAAPGAGYLTVPGAARGGVWVTD